MEHAHEEQYFRQLVLNIDPVNHDNLQQQQTIVVHSTLLSCIMKKEIYKNDREQDPGEGRGVYSHIWTMQG